MIITKNFFNTHDRISFLKPSADLNFNPIINLVYAPNGTGKSTILDAFMIEEEEQEISLFKSGGEEKNDWDKFYKKTDDTIVISPFISDIDNCKNIILNKEKSLSLNNLKSISPTKINGSNLKILLNSEVDIDLDNKNITSLSDISQCFTNNNFKELENVFSKNKIDCSKIFNNQSAVESFIKACSEISENKTNLKELNTSVDFLHKKMELLNFGRDIVSLEKSESCPLCDAEIIDYSFLIETIKEKIECLEHDLEENRMKLVDSFSKNNPKCNITVDDVEKISLLSEEQKILFCVAGNNRSFFELVTKDIETLDEAKNKLSILEQKAQKYFLNFEDANLKRTLRHFFEVYYGSDFGNIDEPVKNVIEVHMKRKDLKFSTGEINLLMEYIIIQNFKFSSVEYLVLDDPVSSFDNVNKHFLLNEINLVIDNLLLKENVSSKNSEKKRLVIMTHDFYSFLKLNNYIFIKTKGMNTDELINSLVLDKINGELKQFNFDPSLICKFEKNDMTSYGFFSNFINGDFVLEYLNCLTNNLDENEGPVVNERVRNSLLHYDRPSEIYNYNSNPISNDILLEHFVKINKDWVLDNKDLSIDYFKNIAFKARVLLETRLFIDKKIYEAFPDCNWKGDNETKQRLRIIKNNKDLKQTFKDKYSNYDWDLIRCHFDILNESVHLIDNNGFTFNESSIIFNIKLDDLLAEVEFIKGLFI